MRRACTTPRSARSAVVRSVAAIPIPSAWRWVTARIPSAATSGSTGPSAFTIVIRSMRCARARWSSASERLPSRSIDEAVRIPKMKRTTAKNCRVSIKGRRAEGGGAKGKILPALAPSVVQLCGRLAAEDPIRENRISRYEWQYDRRPDEQRLQGRGVGGRLPDREPVDDHVGVDAVGEPGEGEGEDEHRGGIGLPVGAAGAHARRRSPQPCAGSDG